VKLLRVALVVSLALLVGLAVVGDVVARRTAQGVLADQARAELGTRPTVDIVGFPFLTQAVRGRYDEIRVSAPQVDRAGVSLRQFRAHLTGVRVPLSEVLHGSVPAVSIDRLEVTALVPYGELAAAAGGRVLVLGPAADGVRVDATVRVLGRDVAVTAESALQLDGDTVTVTARRLLVGGTQAGGVQATALRGRLDLRVRLSDLPYGVTLTAVQPGADGVTVSAQARGTVLGR